MSRSPIFYGWTIVAALSVVSFSLHAVAIFSFGLFVLPMTADLGISRAAIGLVALLLAAAGGPLAPARAQGTEDADLARTWARAEL